MTKTIYVVEDDEGIREVYDCAFKNVGYQIKSFETAEELFQQLKVSQPHLIILDLMLPKMDGLTALNKIKSNYIFKNIPVVIISARSEESIKVKGLIDGADDYLTKPFSILELVARVNNIIKRVNPQLVIEKLSYRELIMDDKKHLVTVTGKKLELTPKAYKILKLLLENKGQVVTRNQIFDKVWGIEVFSESRTLDIHINTIRQEIANYSTVNYLKTIRGVGFMIGE